jgi:two-component sensor histidine kinase/HAMP domain-containing protein
MTNPVARRFAALSTAAKLLLILTAALLPIGLALMWVAQRSIGEANEALRSRAAEQAGSASRAIESLVARNALALRIAANGAFVEGPNGACERVQRSLSIAPAVARQFRLDAVDGTPVCTVGAATPPSSAPLVAPGAIDVRVAPERQSLVLRVGVVGGIATASVPASELRTAALERGPDLQTLVIRDESGELEIFRRPQGANARPATQFTEWPLANSQLVARAGASAKRIAAVDRLILSLPLLMWVTAALISWLLVNRLLIRPLRTLERTVRQLQPGESLNLPTKLGPATEIEALRDAFARSFARTDESERDMAAALDGQRRLVREVHHRVKNNLQVIASLLNIHGRSAETAEARAAYAAIGRRVGALSIVHRNHFAEMEENRGIAIRPLVSELAAELRAGAPDPARRMMIDLDVESVNTTQDVAVSTAFLVTEIVEYAMLHQPQEPVEVSVRRTSELTAKLSVGSPVLVPEDTQRAEKVQFERIIGGLAKQLRSNLDRRLGRYSVDLPVFPES